MTQELRLVVVAQEFPYPPNHGGRADVWRRLRAFKALGVKTALVCWYDEGMTNPSDEELQAVREVVDVLHVVPKRGGLGSVVLRLCRIAANTPSHAAARVLDGEQSAAAFTKLIAFKPHGVLLDSPYGGVFARAVCKRLRVPMFYRSHNIEHLYFQSQAAAATGLRDRLAWGLACLHLQQFEKRLQQEARISFDISADDMAFWQAQGITNNKWLPPLPEAALDTAATQAADTPEQRELTFLGNLHAPNNVQGLKWFVEEVMPLVWLKRPQTIFTMAGSGPNDTVRRLGATNANIRLVENVIDVPSFLASSRVLVNPVLTGSGVNVKTLDMLMTDRPIVSTPQGVAGLVSTLQSLCLVASSATQFAYAVIQALEVPAINLPERHAGRAMFSVDSVALAVESIRGVVFGDRDPSNSLIDTNP